MTRHGRRSWGGRKVYAFTALVLATYGTDCHLCERPGADSVDHIIPVSIDPNQEWALANARPAHRSCNYSRGAMSLDEWFAKHPLLNPVELAPSREWY